MVSVWMHLCVCVCERIHCTMPVVNLSNVCIGAFLGDSGKLDIAAGVKDWTD